ncbi:MAG: helix-hairpin-helix domain-containing protein [Desulfurococcaceae archaeon]
MTVLVDVREKGSIVPRQLEKLGTPIEYVTLEVGDYLIGDLCCERKDVSDYVGSLISGRLNEQLYNMSYNYPISILIVEGFVDEVLVFRKLKRQQYISSLAGAVLKRAPEGNSGVVNVICLSTPFDTALFIHYLHEKVVNQDLFRIPKVAVKRKASLEERQLTVLMSLPGIGEERARALLKRFKTLKNVINASFDELLSVPGIGEKTAKEILKVVNSEAEVGRIEKRSGISTVGSNS